MQITDLLFIFMLAGATIAAGTLIYAVNKKVKIDVEGNRHLLVIVVTAIAVGLAAGLGYVMLTAA
ncbi:hypothetical protein ACFVGV_09565 [Pseudarthrobacter scleromae]|uniref:hypothetical protein n=1 Tax=Pseudarthrobacter scleromae TaxID=158897 RepID=UPI003635CF4F